MSNRLKNESSPYLFTPPEVENVLGKSDGREFCRLCDVTERGNSGKGSLPNLLKSGSPELPGGLISRLYRYRQNRFSLRTDDKIPAFWNGLMTAAMCSLYRASRKGEYLSAAAAASPSGHAMFLLALCEHEFPPPRVTVVPGKNFTASELPFEISENVCAVVLEGPTTDFPLKNGLTKFYVCKGKLSPGLKQPRRAPVNGIKNALLRFVPAQCVFFIRVLPQSKSCGTPVLPSPL